MAEEKKTSLFSKIFVPGALTKSTMKENGLEGLAHGFDVSLSAMLDLAKIVAYVSAAYFIYNSFQ